MLTQITIINNFIHEYYLYALEEYEISFMQWSLLKAIYCYDSFNLNAKKLEQITGQNKRLISINLKKLEQLGYITRSEIEGDKRNKEIIIEEHMLDTCEILLSIDNEVEEILLNNLSSSQQKELSNLLKIIIESNNNS